jgi:glutaredoxin/glutathione-dependent peroxiredoxin
LPGNYFYRIRHFIAFLFVIGYINAAEQIKAKGIDEIVCMAVNDPYVMAAWGHAQNATGKVSRFV